MINPIDNNKPIIQCNQIWLTVNAVVIFSIENYGNTNKTIYLTNIEYCALTLSK